MTALKAQKQKEIERLSRHLDYEEQRLNAELNTKQRQKDEMLRFHVEKRKELEELHVRALRSMKAEHDRKKLSDDDKFTALLEQKQEAIEQFDETMVKLELDQKVLLEQMTSDNAKELR